MTGVVDPGSIGSNRVYNEHRGLGPWDAGYRVMEDDLKLQIQTAADRRLVSVYGDTIHLNDGTHLHGGIDPVVDRRWQRWWLKVVSVDLKLWIPPLGCADGKRFVNILANEFQSVRLRKSNSEKAVLFCPLVLHRKRTVVGSE